MEFFLVILAIAVLVLYFILLYSIAERFYRAACEKGYNDRAYFYFSFWLGLVGWLMVIALPDKNARQTTAVPSSFASEKLRANDAFSAYPSSNARSMGGSQVIRCPNCGAEQSDTRDHCYRCFAALRGNDEQ